MASLKHVLVGDIITPHDTVITSEELSNRLTYFFEFYQSFNGLDYVIEEISFHLSDEDTGMGHTEGILAYTAILKSTETIIFKGHFKLYMTLSYGYWEFVMPSFDWEN